MKYAKSAARGRGLFMAGSSLSALLLSAAVPAAVLLAPTQVLAADECGVQAADGDPINCAAGTYPTGITYAGVTVPVVLDDTIIVSDGGITLNASSGSLDSVATIPDGGDLQITNTTGAGLTLNGGGFTVDLTDEDGGDAPGFITGTIGVYAGGFGPISLNLGNLAITGTDAAFGGVAALSTFGNVSITASGAVTSAGIGVFGGTFEGSTSINVGNVTAAGLYGVGGIAFGAGNVDINTGAVSGDTYSIISQVEDGTINVNASGDLTGDVMLTAGSGAVNLNAGVVTGNVATMAGGGGVNINTGAVTGDVTGSGWSGAVNINTGDVGGAIMASTFSGGSANINFGSAGADVMAIATGGGSANVNGGSVTGNVLATADTGGSASIGVGAVTGDVIAIATGGGSANASTGDVTGAVMASADGSGGVSVSTGAVSDGVTATAAGDGAVSVITGGAITNGIVATSNGGPVSVSASGDVSDNIVATTTGAGSVTVTAANVTGTGTPITATSDSGDVSVTINGTVTGDTGFLADIDTTGSVTLGIGSGVTASQSSFDVTLGNMLTINNGGTWTGAIDFTAATSGHFNNSSTWDADAITFTEGDDSFSNSGTANFPGTLTYDFLGGTDSFSNSGTMDVGTALTLENLENFTNSGTLTIGTSLTVDDASTFGNSGTIALGTDAGASTLTLGSATAFSNTGTIVLGAMQNDDSEWVSDGETNDRIVADGATFTGGGTLLMDVDFSGAQADCSAAVSADCLSLVGGTTSGVTTIRLNGVGAATGSLGSIVLVDVAGGTSADADFVLDADSELEKGLFFYRLGYDADNQQHALTGIAGRGVFEFAQVATSAQSVWYTSTGTWFERHADLRNQLDADGGPGVWLRGTRTNTNREVLVSNSFGTETFEYNLGHEQDTTGIIGGIDLVRGSSEGGAYVLGLTAGKLDSEVDFKVSPGSTNLEGESYGAYASWVSNRFFVDGIFQVNKLDVEQSWNTGGLASGEVKSTGAQVEAGWRFAVNDEEAFVEPLASLAVVRTEIDELLLPGPGGAIEYDDAKSLRGSLGVRISGDADLGSVIVKLSGTGRVWNELEGENRADLMSGGEELNLVDDLSGTFGDIGVGLSFYSPNTRISGFFSTGVKFKEDYLSSDTSIGVRVQW